MFAYYGTYDSDFENMLYYVFVQRLFDGLEKIIIGLAFLVSSIMSNYRLKTYFPNFYRKNKCILKVSLYGLSAPIIISGLFNISLYVPVS